MTNSSARCPRCGDPLPLDGVCDCAGDVDRDARAAYRDLKQRPMPIRLGRNPWREWWENKIVDVWV